MENFVVEDLLKLLLAVLIGGLIGAEREFRDKAAGFRTIIFICVGSTLFTILSAKLGGDREPSRIAASIVSGIGFLGAGAILQGKGRVLGLTTASTIWMAAALGMGIGGGYYLTVLLATAATLIVLLTFRGIENLIHRNRDVRTYEVHSLPEELQIEQVEQWVKECGLKQAERKKMKAENKMITTWTVYGSSDSHYRFMDQLFSHSAILEFKV
jgi:putative Mg2+ transporter-C (MgtC) family protein